MINPNGPTIEYLALGKLIELGNLISEEKRRLKIHAYLAQAAKIRYFLKALDNKQYLSDDQVNQIYQCLAVTAEIFEYPSGLALMERQAPGIATGLKGDTGEQGPPGDPAVLPNGQIFIGNVSNVATPQTVLGDISLSNAGLAAITPNVIVNADINVAAAIALTKLASLTASKVAVTDGSGVLTTATPTVTEINHVAGVTSPIQAQIDSKIGAPTGAISNIVSSNLTPNRGLISDGAGKIVVSAVTATEEGYLSGVTSGIQAQLNAKQATITGGASTITSIDLTANRALISSGTGKVAVHGTTTNTEIGYLTGVTSAIQTQLNSKLGVSLISPANGDIIYFNGSNWVNLPRGTNGQALYSTAGSIQWNTPTINGIPVGGSSNQVLAKNSGTDFDTSWQTLTLAHIPSITSSAAELNILDGVTATTAELNYVAGVTSAIQAQINNKLTNLLPLNAIFVGNSSNLAVPLAAGSNGQVLTITAGVPSWQTLSGTGTVTSVNVSGGTTGLSFTGGPVTTTGTITASGTLVVANGGTGATTLTANRLLFGNGTSAIGHTGPYWDNTNSRLGIGVTSPNASLQFASVTDERKIVFYQSGNNDHQIFGIGLDATNDRLKYKVSSTIASHRFYAGTSTTTSDELFRITGTGKLFIPIAPTNDNTETSVLVRQSDGEIQTRAASTLGGVSDGDKGDITVSASGATWTIDSNVLSSGTYTPTATSSGNIDSVTPSLFMYTRIGDKVTVWGYLDVDVTSASAPTSFYLSLPIASDLTVLEDLYGVGSLVTNSGLFASAVVSADTAGNRADIDFNSGATTTSQPMYVTFTYKIK